MSGIRELYLRFRQLLHEGAKFLIVGAIGTIVTFGIANALQPYGKYKAVTAATIVATVVTFLGNRHWSFNQRRGQGTVRESTIFFVLNGIGLVIYYGCIWLIMDAAGLGGHGHDVKLWYNFALVLGTGLGTVFRFWSYRKWVWLAPLAPAADVTPSQPGPVPGGPEQERLAPVSTAAGPLAGEDRYPPPAETYPALGDYRAGSNGHAHASGNGAAASGGRHVGVHRRR